MYEIPWTFILIHRKYIFKAGKRRWKLLLATKRLHLVGKGDGNIRCTLQPMWKSIYLCESLKDSHEGYINVMINLSSRVTWKLTQSFINTTGTRGQGKFVKVQIVSLIWKWSIHSFSQDFILHWNDFVNSTYFQCCVLPFCILLYRYRYR